MQPSSTYERVSKQQQQHAQSILGPLIGAILTEVPRSGRSAILRSALNSTDRLQGSAFPISPLIPKNLTAAEVRDIWDGMASTLMAASLSNPSQTLGGVLKTAASLATGKPMSGDPETSCQVPLSSVVNAACASGYQDPADPSFNKAIRDIAAYYDCAMHKSYLGGSVIDGIRGVAQEIAGVFSKKKDLQGDYTRAKYKYDRDPSSSQRATDLADAAKILVSYLQSERPNDKLLSDAVLSSWATKSTLSDDQAETAWRVSDKASDVDAVEDSQDGGESGGSDGSGSKKDSSTGDRSDSTSGKTDNTSDKDLLPKGISHTEDIPEVLEILRSLVESASKKASDASITQRTSSLTSYRTAAALAWLTAGDDLIALCLGCEVPSAPDALNMFDWCYAVARVLSKYSEEAATKLANINLLTPEDAQLANRKKTLSSIEDSGDSKKLEDTKRNGLTNDGGVVDISDARSDEQASGGAQA